MLKMKIEEWRHLDDFSGYWVSDQGRVKRYKLMGEILCATNGRYVHLVKKGKRRNMQVSRLVLIAFKGKPPAGKPLALHRDDCFSNNRLTNLRWGSYKDNLEDRRANGKLPSGEKSPLAVLSSKEVARIRKLYKGKGKEPSQDDLAALFKVNQGTISKIVNGYKRANG